MGGELERRLDCVAVDVVDEDLAACRDDEEAIAHDQDVFVWRIGSDERAAPLDGVSDDVAVDGMSEDLAGLCDDQDAVVHDEHVFILRVRCNFRG